MEHIAVGSDDASTRYDSCSLRCSASNLYINRSCLSTFAVSYLCLYLVDYEIIVLRKVFMNYNFQCSNFDLAQGIILDVNCPIDQFDY